MNRRVGIEATSQPTPEPARLPQARTRSRAPTMHITSNIILPQRRCRDNTKTAPTTISSCRYALERAYYQTRLVDAVFGPQLIDNSALDTGLEGYICLGHDEKEQGRRGRGELRKTTYSSGWGIHGLVAVWSAELDCADHANERGLQAAVNSVGAPNVLQSLRKTRETRCCVACNDDGRMRRT